MNTTATTSRLRRVLRSASDKSPARGATVSVAVPIVAVLIELLVSGHDNPRAVAALGLISVTPWPIFLLVVALTASFVLAIRGETPNAIICVAHLVALAFLTHGLPSLLEQEPRFPTAWLHVGFVQSIITVKHPLVWLDARFSWPGFFTGAAALVGLAGLPSAAPLLRWTPLVFNLAYLLPIYITARALVHDSRRAWLVAWFFVLTNWVGQDYFSPQGFTYLLLLGTIAIIAWAFQDPAHSSRAAGIVESLLGRLRLNSLPSSGTGAGVSRYQQVGLLLVLVLVDVALNMAHQLTPVVLAVDVCFLVLLGRTMLPLFALIAVLVTLTWVSYGAVDFWSSHLSTIFGSGGAQSVSSNVGQRIRGSFGHELVVYVRLALTALVWLSAAAGTLSSWRRFRQLPVAALCLAVVPLPIVLGQAYGGEAQLRLYFYTLPFMLMLAMSGVRPGQMATQKSLAMMALISVVLFPAFLVARFGNEQFEQASFTDIATARALFRLAPPGATVITATFNVFLRFERFSSYVYRPADLQNYYFKTPGRVLREYAPNPKGVFFILTPAEIEYAVASNRFAPSWGATLARELRASPRFRQLYAHGGGWVFRIVAPPRPTAPATARAPERSQRKPPRPAHHRGKR